MVTGLARAISGQYGSLRDARSSCFSPLAISASTHCLTRPDKLTHGYFAYFAAARAYLEAWGKPIAFYSDKHGVFRVNQRGALGGDGMTQFGRALSRCFATCPQLSQSPDLGSECDLHNSCASRQCGFILIAGWCRNRGNASFRKLKRM